MKRRELLQAGGVTALGGSVAFAQQQPRPIAATDRIGVGIIGCGNMGTFDQKDFQANADVDVVAVCDVYAPNAERAQQLAGGKATIYSDYRRLLENRDVQAVVIATPEHWHAIMCIDACDAGKDVYVEKPASHNIRDGRLMVDAARRNNRVVQVGSQQRSGVHFQRVVGYVQEGRIGDVHYVTCWNHSASPAARPTDSQTAVPAGMDWDMWLGPAPKLPYGDVMSVGRRYSWDFFGGSLTEWGAHSVDIVLWAMKEKAPLSIVAAGGKFHRTEGDIPDTLQVSYEFPRFVLQYSVLQHNSFGPNGDAGAARFGSYGTQFHGSKGTLFVDRAGFRITPQFTRYVEPQHPPRPAVLQPDERQPGHYYVAGMMPEVSDTSVQHLPHVRNFLDCVKSRQRPIADIEDGHRTNTVCRLGNIAYRVRRRLQWDGDKEVVVNDDEANRLVKGTYRDPWRPKGI
jgi:predicted dehydrogenase